MQRASRYLLLLATATWRASGPTWVGIDRLIGLMFGLSVALAYLTCRVKMPSGVSLAVALLFMFSPLQLANAGDLRDYSKAPFFLASLLIVALLVSRRLAPAIVLVLAAAAGAVLGFGYGVRTDIAINLIVVIVTIVGFLPDPIRESWKLRIDGLWYGSPYIELTDVRCGSWSGCEIGGYGQQYLALGPSRLRA